MQNYASAIGRTTVCSDDKLFLTLPYLNPYNFGNELVALQKDSLERTGDLPSSPHISSVQDSR